MSSIAKSRNAERGSIQDNSSIKSSVEIRKDFMEKRESTKENSSKKSSVEKRKDFMKKRRNATAIKINRSLFVRVYARNVNAQSTAARIPLPRARSFSASSPKSAKSSSSSARAKKGICKRKTSKMIISICIVFMVVLRYREIQGLY